jgi:hypothetical protein
MAVRSWSYAAALALVLGGVGAADAQTLDRYHHRHVVPHGHFVYHRVSHGDDVVVHTGRSYLDPGPSAEIGTEDRYFYDTAHYDFRSEGPDFTQNVGGFEMLQPRP